MHAEQIHENGNACFFFTGNRILFFLNTDDFTVGGTYRYVFGAWHDTLGVTEEVNAEPQKRKKKQCAQIALEYCKNYCRYGKQSDDGIPLFRNAYGFVFHSQLV